MDDLKENTDVREVDFLPHPLKHYNQETQVLYKFTYPFKLLLPVKVALCTAYWPV
jgi:hypothetical protein